MQATQRTKPGCLGHFLVLSFHRFQTATNHSCWIQKWASPWDPTLKIPWIRQLMANIKLRQWGRTASQGSHKAIWSTLRHGGSFSMYMVSWEKEPLGQSRCHESCLRIWFRIFHTKKTEYFPKGKVGNWQTPNFWQLLLWHFEESRFDMVIVCIQSPLHNEELDPKPSWESYPEV